MLQKDIQKDSFASFTKTFFAQLMPKKSVLCPTIEDLRATITNDDFTNVLINNAQMRSESADN